MSEPDDYDSLIDESARRRFEQAWLNGSPQPIESYLGAQRDANYLPTLEELVLIELEFAWEAYAQRLASGGADDATLASAPMVEDYVRRFPQLGRPAILQRLIEQELRVRCSVGHPASLDDYRHRFPELMNADGSDFAEQLQSIAAALSATTTEDEQLAATVSSGGPGPIDAAERSAVREFGGYELLRELGRGGMGIVYQARQSSADRLVALKVIRRDWLESMPAAARAAALDRFQHEAQAAARIEHEHIVRVYEVGAVDGDPFFSMQYVDGQSLADLARAHPLSGQRVATLLEPVARAVDEAHRRGILHRDLKPQNILVDRATGAALVADFGLAKLVEANDELTRAGDIMGSPPYMSPEQAQDSSHVTTQSDVYALGATLYHALAGKPPFRADTVYDTLMKVVQEPPVLLRQLNPEVDLDLETICHKCLEKEPERRYASAAALADDLRRYIDGEPISARPVGTLERGWLWCRRNPLVATLTASTAIFLLLTLIASLIGFLQTSRALDVAEQRHRETRRVINNFFTRVSENRLLNEPGMQPLRKELLEDVLPYYRRFLVEFAEDTTLRDELALTHFRIGLLTEIIDTPQDALPWYETAREMQVEIFSEQPARGDCLCDLGNTLTAIGRALQLQLKYRDARGVFEQAIMMRQRLVDMRPDDVEAKRMLASSHMNLGLLHKDRGEGPEAESQFQLAQSIRQKLLDVEPDNELILRDFGKGAYNQAELACQLADIRPETSDHYLAEARQFLSQAMAVFERLLSVGPNDMGNQYRLALCCRNLADLDDDFQSSMALYRRSLKQMEALALRNPDVPVYQAGRAALRMNIGFRCAKAGQVERALENYEAARPILQDLVTEYANVPRYRRDLAILLKESAILVGDAGDVDTARRHLEAARDHFAKLLEKHPQNEEYAQDLSVTEQLLEYMAAKMKTPAGRLP
jgi:serine/threonine protein kinase